VSGDPDPDSDSEEPSRRRVLALLGTGLLTLVGAGAGVSNLFGDDGDGGSGVDLSVEYSVTPDEPTVTPTPTPAPDGGVSNPDDATAPPAAPNGTATADEGPGGAPTPTEAPRRYDDPDDDPRSDESTTATPSTTPSGELVGASIPPVSVSDAEPGDGGTVDLSLTLSGEPARLWVRGDVTAVEEGGTNEAERDAGDTGAPGELQEYVRVRLSHDADDAVVYEGTLADLDDVDGWIALTEACVTPGAHTARFRWDLPPDAPNVVQTDGVSFSLGVAADTDGC
jgi:hypothetical protein